MAFRVLTAAALLTGGLATSANAVFLDFTSAPFDNFSGQATRTVDLDTRGADPVMLSATNGNINTTEAGPTSAPFCTGALGGVPTFACLNDGIGINTLTGAGEFDEINAIADQVLTIQLSEVVNVTAIYLLDFFSVGDSTSNAGTASLTAGDTTNVFGLVPQVASGDETPNTGFTVINIFSPADTIAFSAEGLDGFGPADFAVAGIEYNLINDNGDTMIPVPAALPLLLTAMVGLGILGRRRRDV